MHLALVTLGELGAWSFSVWVGDVRRAPWPSLPASQDPPRGLVCSKMDGTVGGGGKVDGQRGQDFPSSLSLSRPCLGRMRGLETPISKSKVTVRALWRVASGKQKCQLDSLPGQGKGVGWGQR